jgi:hypothetical protein
MIAALAASYAADYLGYHGAAALIREQQLGPRAIVRLFACSASPDRGHVVAVVLIAGATAKFNVCRKGWNGDIERELQDL